MPASTFYRDTVTLAGIGAIVTGYVYRARPAFAVTRVTPRHGWTVTHVPTGCSVTRPVPKLRDAQARLRELSGALPVDLDLSSVDPASIAFAIEAFPAAMAVVHRR